MSSSNSMEVFSGIVIALVMLVWSGWSWWHYSEVIKTEKSDMLDMSMGIGTLVCLLLTIVCTFWLYKDK